MKGTKGVERLVGIIADGLKPRRSDAAYQLYWIFRDGEGVRADKKRAMGYLHVAAENGLTEAMYQLGWHYGTGTFVGKNIVKAIDWYRKAADKGDAWAQVDLGQKIFSHEVCIFIYDTSFIFQYRVPDSPRSLLRLREWCAAIRQAGVQVLFKGGVARSCGCDVQSRGDFG